MTTNAPKLPPLGPRPPLPCAPLPPPPPRWGDRRPLPPPVKDAVLAVLVDMRECFEKTIPQFNWGTSALSGKAIRQLNELPGKVEQVINQLENL